MNLLGHAFLSFGDEDVLCGNMMGDFVKGKKILDSYPESIKTGLLLHRKIDAFTDNHPAVLKAKNIFRPFYRLYSGPIIDVLFDHFLANDPKYFSSEKKLHHFTQNIFPALEKNRQFQPEPFQQMCWHLQSEEILYQYRTLKGIKTALKYLCQRMQYAADETNAIENTMRYYYELNQYYFDFMDSIVIYAKNELNHT